MTNFHWMNLIPLVGIDPVGPNGVTNKDSDFLEQGEVNLKLEFQ